MPITTTTITTATSAGNKRKTIVFCTDGNERSLAWLEVALRSLRKTLGNAVRVVVCADEPRDFGYGTETVDANRIIDAYDMRRVSVCKFHDIPVSPMMFFRIALPLVEELRDEETVVYVDTDVEFESEKFMGIFNEDMREYDVAGVQTCLRNPRVAQHNIGTIRDCGGFDDPRVPESSKDRMYNGVSIASGLLLMNLSRMRTAYGDFGEYLRHMIGRYAELHFEQNDESLINLYLKCRTLSPSYNAWSSVLWPGEEVYLRHYPGGRKVTRWFYPERRDYRPQEKVDVVFTAGPKIEHDDIQLKWAIRSLEKYGRNVDRVIVTSPIWRDWLSGDVIQIICDDYEEVGFKHKNILKAIIETISVLDLHGEFLVSSDDHYYVKPVDFAQYPFNVQKWRIPTEQFSTVRKINTMKWKQSCIDTGKFLVEYGYPCLDFQMHSNAHWNADIVRDHIDLFKKANTLRFGVEPHVLMQNLWVSLQPKIPIRCMDDIKLKEYHGIDPSWECISCYRNVFEDAAFLDFLNGEFGEKCRYEK